MQQGTLGQGREQWEAAHQVCDDAALQAARRRVEGGRVAQVGDCLGVVDVGRIIAAPLVRNGRRRACRGGLADGLSSGGGG